MFRVVPLAQSWPRGSFRRSQVVTAGLPSRQLRLPVPGVFERGTFLRGRVLAYRPARGPGPRDHRRGPAHGDPAHGGPAHDAAYDPAYDAAYDVSFLDGPYDHDETPDGTVRLVLDPGVEAARLAAAHAAAAAGQADFRSSESPATLDASATTRLVLKGVRPALLSADLRRRVFTPWCVANTRALSNARSGESITFFRRGARASLLNL
jgi:hypothetical protein